VGDAFGILPQNVVRHLGLRAQDVGRAESGMRNSRCGHKFLLGLLVD
jgi:hypothetical protein